MGDTEVVELYRQAREFFHQHRRRAFEIALQTFSQILEVSPDYAKAYAGIADCHSFLSLYFGESPTQADHASRKALEIDPNLAEAHASRGLAHFVHGNLSKAEQELSLAIQLAPELYDPHYVFGRVCFTEGRFAEAVTHFRNACARASDAYDSWYLLSMCYRRLEDTAGAEQAEVDCIAAVRWRVLHHPDDTRAWTMGAAVLAKQGERDKAGEWIEKALRIDSGEPIIEYNAACVYAGLSRFDDALRCLKASVGHAGISTAWVKNDPDLDALRNDPRYSDFLSNLEPMAATS